MKVLIIVLIALIAGIFLCKRSGKSCCGSGGTHKEDDKKQGGSCCKP